MIGGVGGREQGGRRILDHQGVSFPLADSAADTNVAERFWRELRVDRIWEGTSEIQRLIIVRSLERRGVERVIR